MEYLRRFYDKFRLYLRITGISGIARRYFVKNGIDGSLTMLGIIVGAWGGDVTQSKIIILAGLGGGVAMGVSGVFGTYLAEIAERKRQLKNLERSMLTDLSNSMHDDAANVVSIYAALIDGGSPMLTSLISLFPFLLTMKGVFPISQAYVLSILLTLLSLFSLGLFMGRTARDNIWVYGAKTIVAGIVTTAIVVLFGFI